MLPLISPNYLIRRRFSLHLLFSFTFRRFLLVDALRFKLVKFLHPCHFLSCLTHLPHLCPPSFPSFHHRSASFISALEPVYFCSLLYFFFVLHFILLQDSIPFPILLCFISQKEKTSAFDSVTVLLDIWSGVIWLFGGRTLPPIGHKT